MATHTRLNGDGGPRATTKETPGSIVFWSVLRRRYRLLGIGLIVGLTLAAAYCLLAPPCYESSTQILVVKKEATLPSHNPEGQRGFEQAFGEDLLATHMLIMKSPRVVQDALRQHQLDQRPTLQKALSDDQDVVEYVAENLRVTRGGEGQGRLAHVVTLQFRHGSAEDCADVVQAVVDAYRSFLEDGLSSPVDDALTLIEQAKDEIQEELLATRLKYRQFRERAPLFWKGTERLNVHQARQESLEIALAEIRLQIIDTQARLETLRSDAGSAQGALDLLSGAAVSTPRASASRQPGSNASISSLIASRQPGQTETARAEFTQLLTLKLQKRELLGDLGVDHPRVLRAQESIEEMESFLQQKRTELAGSYKQLLEHELQELKRRGREIVRMLQAEEEAAKALVQAELEDEVLRNELDRNQQLFDSVVARLDEINLARDFGGFATETIAPVKLGEKISPQPILAVSVGAFLGLCLGLLSAVVADHTSFPTRGISWETDRPSAPASSPVLHWTPNFQRNDFAEVSKGEPQCQR